MRRDHFDAWLQNFFLRMTALVKVWATKWLTKLANETPSAQILAVVRQLETTVNGLAITQTGFYPP